MLEGLKQTGLAQRFKASALWRMVKQSAGDWRFPFMLLAWRVAAYLTRRRTVAAGGISYTLPCDNRVTHFRWFLFNKKEPEVRGYIDKYVKEGDVFFDVGANIGVFSLYAAKKYNNITIYSFEPEYSNLNELKKNIYINNLSGKIRPWSVGISDFVGFSELHLQDLSAGAAESTESRDPISKTDEGYEIVFSEGIFVATVDHICEKIGVVPNSLKIDTDGNELKILTGAKKTLLNTVLRSLIIEYPCDAEKGSKCREVLMEAGFKLAWEDKAKTRNEIWAR